MEGVIDTDVLLKSNVYGLFDQLLESIPLSIANFGVLGSTKFVVRNKIKYLNFNRQKGEVIEALNNSLSKLKELEPTMDEIQFASELELMVQKLNVGFDVGESQLCAMVISRKMQCLVTGDKRAIISAESLINSNLDVIFPESKFICLEQCFSWLLKKKSIQPHEVRAKVCSEPGIDQALNICFSCRSPYISPESWMDGLCKYIQCLLSEAPNVLYKR